MKPIHESFPYYYVGGGYFRHCSLPKDTGDGAYTKQLAKLEEQNIPAMLHGGEAILYLINKS